jgi:multiple sugar transport system permease protein
MVSNARRFGLGIVVVLVALWVLVPLGWMVNMTFMTERQILTRPPYPYPPSPQLENYYYVFNARAALEARRSGAEGFAESATFFLPEIATEIPQALGNSVTVALTIVAMNIVAATMAGYTFSRAKFRGSWPMFLFTITSRLLPPVAVLIPFFLIIRSLGLLDNLGSLILIYGAYTLPISIWIIHGYLQALPPDLEEAARVDGYSKLEVIFNTVFPVMRPGIVAIGIYSFMIAYVEFFFAFILTGSAASHTIPVIIASMGANPVSPKGILMAAGLVTMLPPVLLIIFFRRFIISGLITSAVK